MNELKSNPPSWRKLMQGAIKIIENAQRLCDESELLHKNKMFARSYTLSHLAREETGKSLMIASAALKLASGKEIDWKKLSRRMASHSEKIIIDKTISDILFGSSMIESGLDPVVMYSDHSVKFTNNRKNGSLYVNYMGGEFVSPTELITDKLSERNLSLAAYRTAYVSETILKLQGFTKIDDETVKGVIDIDEALEAAERYANSLYDEQQGMDRTSLGDAIVKITSRINKEQ